MKLLITGSTGVVGREILSIFKKKRINIFPLSYNSGSSKYSKVDLTKTLNKKTKADFIIHCAGKTPQNSRNLKDVFNKNIKMNKNLINFANKNNIKILIFLSAMDVYGKISKRTVYENTKPFNPDLYGRSKLFSEKLFLHKKNKFKTVVLRIPGVLTFDFSRDRPLIVGIIKKILKNDQIEIFNSKKNFNNILDCKELARIIAFIIKKKYISSGIYNVSASKPIKFIQVVKMIKNMLGSDSKIMSKKAKQKSFIISNNKLQKIFNIKISTTEKIVKRSCNYILKRKYSYS